MATFLEPTGESAVSRAQPADTATVVQPIRQILPHGRHGHITRIVMPPSILST